MKSVLSLFDHSGNWSAPYYDQGHNVLEADIKNENPVNIAALDCQAYFEGLELDEVDGILAAPPCTTFTSAAAWVWPKQDAKGETALAVHLAYQVLRSVELWRPDFWVLENPAGRLNKLVPELGKARLIFNPWEFAGYTTTPEEEARLAELRGYFAAGIPFTKEDLALIKRTGAYTKQTCLWGDFNLPEKRPIEPVRVCKQGSWLQKLGGKGEKTKAARSETPLGFAMAFHKANSWSDEQVAAWAVKQAVNWAGDIFGADALIDDVEEEVSAEMGLPDGFREAWMALQSNL